MEPRFYLSGAAGVRLEDFVQLSLLNQAQQSRAENAFRTFAAARVTVASTCSAASAHGSHQPAAVFLETRQINGKA